MDFVYTLWSVLLLKCVSISHIRNHSTQHFYSCVAKILQTPVHCIVIYKKIHMYNIIIINKMRSNATTSNTSSYSSNVPTSWSCHTYRQLYITVTCTCTYRTKMNLHLNTAGSGSQRPELWQSLRPPVRTQDHIGR